MAREINARVHLAVILRSPEEADLLLARSRRQFDWEGGSVRECRAALRVSVIQYSRTVQEISSATRLLLEVSAYNPSEVNSDQIFSLFVAL